MTPERFLERQEASEIEGLERSARKLVGALEQSVAVDEWIRRHPLLSLAGAMAAGFVLVRGLGRLRPVGWATLRALASPLARPGLAALRSLAAAALFAGVADGRRETREP